MKMSKRSIGSLLIFVIILLVDFVSKKMALSVAPHTPWMGLFELGIVTPEDTNFVVMDPSSTLRVIHYATFIGPLLLIYFFLLSQMSKKQVFSYFQPWVTFWVVGLIGNIMDRMLYGSVLSWFTVKPFNCEWSVASLSVLVGVIGCVVQLVRHRKAVFQFYSKRKMTMTHPRFQTLYILKIIAISCFLAVSLLVFSYTFLKFYVFQFGIIIPKPILRVFLIEFGFIIAVFLGILLLMGLYYSSKIAGPLYAFEQFIERLKKGEDTTLILREDDDMKELESIAKTIKDHWKP
ncbi:MAG: signal peptidase II [Bdellovibrionales bacterium]|nr:signal peptidase II [Bdellovibrionales bacterium]